MKKKIIATTPFVAGMILAGSAVTAYASEQETTQVIQNEIPTNIENNISVIPQTVKTNTISDVKITTNDLSTSNNNTVINTVSATNQKLPSENLQTTISDTSQTLMDGMDTLYTDAKEVQSKIEENRNAGKNRFDSIETPDMSDANYLNSIFRTDTETTNKLLDAINASLSAKNLETVKKLSNDLNTYYSNNHTTKNEAIQNIINATDSSNSDSLCSKTFNLLSKLGIINETERKAILYNINIKEYLDKIDDFYTGLILKVGPLYLMDSYDKTIHKWEHQGYDNREVYFNALFSLQITSCALVNAAWLTQQSLANDDIHLLGMLQTLEVLSELTIVKRLDDNIRHYQVKGHEVYLYANTFTNNETTLNTFSNSTKENFLNFTTTEGELSDYFKSLYTYTGSETEYVGKQAVKTLVLTNILSDYNKTASLYDIFFGKDEGDFILPSNLDSTKSNCFISSNINQGINTIDSKLIYKIDQKLFNGGMYTPYNLLKYNYADGTKIINTDIIDDSNLIMILSVDPIDTNYDIHNIVNQWINDIDSSTKSNTYHFKKCEQGHIVTISEHTYNQPTIKWNDDYKNVTATFVCNENSCSQNVEGTITEHKTDPTCTKEGKIIYTATFTFDGKDYTDTKVKVLEATGHTYAEPTFSWSDDYKSAQASFVCKDDQHEEVVNGIITEYKTDPTCTEKGKIIYTATFTFDGKDYTDTKVKVLEATGHSLKETKKKDATCTEDGYEAYFKCTNTNCGKLFSDKNEENEIAKPTEIKATGHTYAEPTISWSEDYKSVTATFTCEKDKHEEVIDGTISEIKTDPTCTKDGKIVYTATFNFDDKEYNDTKEEVLKATGHTWKNGECSVCHEKETSTYSTNTKSTSKSSTTGTQTGVETKLGFLTTLSLSSALELSFLGLKRKKNK